MWRKEVKTLEQIPKRTNKFAYKCTDFDILSRLAVFKECALTTTVSWASCIFSGDSLELVLYIKKNWCLLFLKALNVPSGEVVGTDEDTTWERGKDEEKKECMKKMNDEGQEQYGKEAPGSQLCSWIVRS